MSKRAFRPIRLWPASHLRETPWSGHLEFLEAETDEGPGAKPVVIVVPGGGYEVNAPTEGHTVAHWLTASGVHAAVLNYRTQSHARRFALADLRRAVRVLRAQANKLNLDPAAVTVLGFSAGGHLAGMAGFCNHLPNSSADDLSGLESATPDRLALIYPIISFQHNVHDQTRAAFLQNDATAPAAQRLYSLENQIHRGSPPVLIVNGTADPVSPITNARALHRQITAKGGQSELMEIKGATHGFVLRPATKGAELKERLSKWISQTQSLPV